MKEKIVCGLVIGEAASAEKAEKSAQDVKDCPYVAFVGAFEGQLVTVYFVPERHLWWLEWVRDEPEIAGLRNVTLQVTDVAKITYPEFELRLPQEKLEVAPCGLVCQECSLFERCSGCPATIYYKGGDYAV
ncbi:hypothetical protein M1N92_05385 [Dehalococcoidia bacterium]|nr:hypothetical protein [Dehalococcoidia bacterium]